MVSLVEIIDDSSFNQSAAGNQHGDIFETMYEYVRDSELNTGKPPAYYEKYMKPLI